MGDPGHKFTGGYYTLDIGGVMQRGECGKFAKSFEDLVVYDDGFNESFSAVHYPVPHGRDLREAAENAGIRACQRGQDKRYRFFMGLAVFFNYDLVPARGLVADRRALDPDPLYDAGG